MADTTGTAANGGSIDTLKGNAQAAFNSVANGPVATNVKDQTAKTSTEFSNLAASRQTPANPAATGQPLTHYHSLFSTLLSWENPRATAIAYAAVATFIFAVRYLNIIRWGLKATWVSLGTTIAAEVAGKLVLNNGLASQFRPRRYYTVSRETLDGLIGDVHELVNFFVIEAQRIVFVENVSVSLATLVAAFISYFLVKIVPYWGLALIGTTVVFFVPLVYKTNQEFIDTHIAQANNMLSAQTNQLKEVASKHTAHATDITKQYMGDYTAKAQQMLRGRSASPEAVSKPAKQYQATDFPAAPKEDFKAAESQPLNKPEEPLAG